MILTGTKILTSVSRGQISIKPFDPQLLNPNSYNYRLGPVLIQPTYDLNNITNKPKLTKIKIPSTGFVLQPNTLYLGTTYEAIGSTHYVPSLIGRSSLGRLGLFLQITADLGHIGTFHKWTLELKVVQPLKIYPYMKIGQVSFWNPAGLNLLKGKLYKDQTNSYAKFNQPTYSNVNKLICQE